MMVVIDSSVWIDYFRNLETPQTIKLDQIMDTEILVVGDLILMELLQGVANKKERTLIEKSLSSYKYYDFVGLQMAYKAAENYQTLRKKGKTIRKSIDCIIATFCIVKNFYLLHNDRDFDPFQDLLGLKVLKP